METLCSPYNSKEHAEDMAKVIKDIKKCDLKWLRYTDTGSALERLSLSILLNKLFKAAKL